MPDIGQGRKPETAKERCSVPSKRTFRGAQRRGLAEAAPFPKSGVDRDVSGARPKWASIDASPGKTTPRFLSGWENLDPRGEWVP